MADKTELNEAQLVLLNSLIYLNKTITPGATVEEIVKSVDVDNITYGGGLTRKNVDDLLEEILKDDTLKKLEVSHYVDGEIRGVCFVDTETDSAVIAFRGTGPLYAAWDDNCQGGYMSDTDMQKQALEFAQTCADKYDNITITGHSKGGNMAQYCTVLMGDEIDRCVSFDGQGFGDEFLRKYAKEIAQNRDKIRSVCAHNDYVNILLTPIAKETVYLSNDNPTFPGGHFIYELYENGANDLNSKGEYVQSKNQSFLIQLADKAVAAITLAVDAMGIGAPEKEFLVYSLVGMLMGALVADEGKSPSEIIAQFLKNIGEYIENLTEQDIRKHTSGKRDVSFRFAVNSGALQNYALTISSARQALDDCRSRVETLKKQMATNIIKDVTLGLPLATVILQLEEESRKLNALFNALELCAELYDTTENQVKAIAG